MGLKRTLALGAKKPKPGLNPLDDDVMKNVDRVIAADSPLMKRAETSGLQLANRRGLLSSTMAVGAAQDAVLDKAIQIGGQEAAQRFTKGQSRLDRILQNRQQGRELDFRGRESRLDRVTANRQQRADLEFRGAESRLDRITGNRMQRADLDFRSSEANRDRITENRQQRTELDFRARETRLDRGMQEKLASWNLGAQSQQQAAGMLSSYLTTYEQSLDAINKNTKLKAEQRAQQTTALNARRDKFLNLTRSLFDVDVTWS